MWSEVGVYLNSMYCRRRARGRQSIYARLPGPFVREGRVLFLERSSHALLYLLALR